MHQLVGVKELAAELGVPPATIHAWLYRGVGPASYKVGRHRRFRREDIDAWLEAQRSEPGPAS